MGRLIDTDKLKDIIEYCILANVPADAENTKEEKLNDWLQTVIDRVQPVEAIPKAEYEARLKAEKMAMLEDLKKEMNPIKDCEHQIYGKEEWNFVGKCQDVIQLKINELKGTNNE